MQKPRSEKLKAKLAKMQNKKKFCEDAIASLTEQIKAEEAKEKAEAPAAEAAK